MSLPFLGPAPDPSGAARLRSLNSPTNMSAFGDVLAGLSAGDQNAGNFGASDALQSRLVDAFDGGPALRALRAAADEHRLQHTQDENSVLADLESGVPHAIATESANIGNDVEDINSERGFSRQTLPFASQDRDRTAAAKSALAQMQYVLPAQLKAQGDIGAAQATAQGARDVETMKQQPVNSLTALRAALAEYIKSTGTIPSADDLARLQTAIK